MRGGVGVAQGVESDLVVSVTGANTVSVAAGGALVDGKPYYSDAAVSVNIPSAVGGGNTRIDRVVLRADWTAQTIRVTRIAGTDAVSPTAPAITTSSGTTYDEKICRVLVDTSGACTVTDERKIRNAIMARQGNDASAWLSAGTTNYEVASYIEQVGIVTVTVADGAVSGQAAVTFPRAFSDYPLVFVSPYISGFVSSRINQSAVALSPNTTGFTAVATRYNPSSTSGAQDVIVQWRAVGPPVA